MTKEELEIELLRCEPNNYEGNFVAAAIQMKDNIAYHAGLLINCDEGTFLIHFNPSGIVLEEPPQDDWYFFKVFSFIDNRLVTAFLALCKSVIKVSYPTFGAYYDGSYFTKEGVYFSKLVRSEYMTCVGFCINVIKGFLSDEEEVEFFQYKDWKNVELSIAYMEPFVRTLQLHNRAINAHDLKENVRRILPIEFLASAYLKTLPIKRKKLIPLVPHLKEILESRVIT